MLQNVINYVNHEFVALINDVATLLSGNWNVSILNVKKERLTLFLTIQQPIVSVWMSLGQFMWTSLPMFWKLTTNFFAMLEGRTNQCELSGLTVLWVFGHLFGFFGSHSDFRGCCNGWFDDLYPSLS